MKNRSTSSAMSNKLTNQETARVMKMVLENYSSGTLGAGESYYLKGNNRAQRNRDT